MNETNMDKMATDLVENENIVEIAECNSGSGVMGAVKVALIGAAVVGATVGIVKGVKALVRRRKNKHKAADEAVDVDYEVIDGPVEE